MISDAVPQTDKWRHEPFYRLGEAILDTGHWILDTCYWLSEAEIQNHMITDLNH